MDSRYLHALVIEDDQTQAMYASATLQKAGFKCDVVGTAAEAVMAIEAKRFHLILADLLLPDGGGSDLLIALRSMEHGARAKIVAYTSHEEKEIIDSALNAGADDVFIKGNHKQSLLESRFRGMASKFRQEESFDCRLERLEQGTKQLLEMVTEIKAQTSRVEDIGEAWITTRRFFELLMKTGHVIDKTKWFWGPAAVLVAWWSTGTLKVG